MTHRVVVVGAGAAGVPFAARLSEDGSYRVTLIDAGDAGPPPRDLLNGGILAGAQPTHSDTLVYRGDLGHERSHTVVRGRRFGGSTATNGGYLIRPTRADLAAWERVGGVDWSVEHALPLLKRMETDLDLGPSRLHGGDGPIRIQRLPQNAPAAQAFRAAALELGFPEEPDKNAGALPGVGPIPSNIIDGVRVNTAMAYLTEDRENLTLMGNTRVQRILFDRSRAAAVETETGTIEADTIVVTAGAIETAALLLRSGVGPRNDLDALGIPVVADLPVGTAFSDHPNVVISWFARTPVAQWDAGFGFSTALHVDAHRVDPGLPSHPQGDLELLLTTKPLATLVTGQREVRDSVDILVGLQHHVGRGRLSLESADPTVPPRLEYRYFGESVDLRRMRAGIRIAARILQTRAFDDLFAGFEHLGPDVLTDDALLDDWIRGAHGTALHTCSTAPMGSVTDGAGRVHQIRGLRIADTSILPTAPHRGPALTSIFLGELLSDRMRHEGPTPE